ncbi:unnamed protein product [Peniophora sp. CBMAI 1063]|nr:unnamed protein product [Peniophora sp. CBMAI 1063]
MQGEQGYNIPHTTPGFQPQGIANQAQYQFSSLNGGANIDPSFTDDFGSPYGGMTGNFSTQAPLGVSGLQSPSPLSSAHRVAMMQGQTQQMHALQTDNAFLRGQLEAYKTMFSSGNLAMSQAAATPPPSTPNQSGTRGAPPQEDRMKYPNVMWCYEEWVPVKAQLKDRRSASKSTSAPSQSSTAAPRISIDLTDTDKLEAERLDELLNSTTAPYLQGPDGKPVSSTRLATIRSRITMNFKKRILDAKKIVVTKENPTGAYSWGNVPVDICQAIAWDVGWLFLEARLCEGGEWKVLELCKVAYPSFISARIDNGELPPNPSARSTIMKKEADDDALLLSEQGPARKRRARKKASQSALSLAETSVELPHQIDTATTSVAGVDSTAGEPSSAAKAISPVHAPSDTTSKDQSDDGPEHARESSTESSTAPRTSGNPDDGMDVEEEEEELIEEGATNAHQGSPAPPPAKVALANPLDDDELDSDDVPVAALSIPTPPVNTATSATKSTGSKASKPYVPSETSLTPRNLCGLDWYKTNKDRRGTCAEFDAHWRASDQDHWTKLSKEKKKNESTSSAPKTRGKGSRGATSTTAAA